MTHRVRAPSLDEWLGGGVDVTPRFRWLAGRRRRGVSGMRKGHNRVGRGPSSGLPMLR